MTTEILNVTHQVVDQKIEDMLQRQAEDAELRVLTDPDFRQKLVLYVLKRVDNCYITVQTEESDVTSSPSPPAETRCQPRVQQLDRLIEEGLEVLRQQAHATASRRQQRLAVTTTPTVEPAEPSHWFG
jgi:hypothetical protein